MIDKKIITEMTINALADEIKISADRLVQQFAEAGISKSVCDKVNVQEKQALLIYLNSKHHPNNKGTHNLDSQKRMMLQRKTRSILNITSSNGKSKSVKIEIRKKRTFIKYDLQRDIRCLSLKEQIIINNTEKTNINEAKFKVTSKNIEHKNLEESYNKFTEKKDKSNNQQKNDRKVKKNQLLEKSYHNYKEKPAEIKCELERKFYKINNKDEGNWNKISYSNDEEFNSHNYITNSRYLNQTEEDNDHEIERKYNRNIKTARQKKNNKHSELKIDREEARAARNNKNNKYKSCVLQQSFQKPVQTVNRNVVIGETITVSELANKMAVKGSQVIKMMMKLGTMVTINQIIDQETAQLVAEEMGHKVTLRRGNDLEESLINDYDANLVAEPRAPVVTIMGHVDHGKTSLLDRIRSTKVASNEAGGITQHIGAYHVKTENGMITFLDTPGHAAFTAMRARGAQITDIIVLVIASDDNVMPQTIEAIQHAKVAKVPIIVALNKIDRLESNPDRLQNELMQYGIISEKLGGDHQFVYISAKTGAGIDELLDAILLQAEILELKAVRKGVASGVVVESYLDKGRGPIATILIRKGTLNKGDFVLCGFEYGKVRAIYDDTGRELIEAGPSIPVEILGLSGVPAVGDELTVVHDEKKARELAFYRQGKFNETKLSRQQKYKFNNILANMVEKEAREVNILLKADVKGSVEAISDSLIKLSTNKVKVKIVGSGVGNINETDANLAIASNAILIGFNVFADTAACRLIETENLDLRYYSVIYDLIDSIKLTVSSMLSPEFKQQTIGLAEVRSVFKSSKFDIIAGCIVIEGIIKRHNPIHVLREKVVIYEGLLESLRRFKEDVNEVRNGMECGIRIKNYNDICVGDVIKVFETIKIQRRID